MNKQQQKAFDECHTFGHAWFEIDADIKPLFGYYMWVKCERCNTIRMDTIDAHGEWGTRSYRYPEGYRDGAKITRADYRIRVLSYRSKRKRAS